MAAASPTFALSQGYAVAGPQKAGEGPIVRNFRTPGALVTTPDENCGNLYDGFLHGLKLRPTAPCLGSRIRADGSVGVYEWETYAEISARVDATAAALWKLDLVPMTPDGQRFFGFFLKNCVDWMVTALACYKTNVCVVPMYDTLGPEVVAYIQKQTQATSALVSAAELEKLLKSGCPFSTVVVTGPVGQDLLRRANGDARFRTMAFSEIAAIGAASLPVLRSLSAPTLADLAVLCYTSGTTGDPKGAMLTHGNVLAAMGNAAYPEWTIVTGDPSAPQDVHLSYLPLAHVFETVIINFMMYGACAVGFYQGSPLKILEDLQALRPTVFASVPRLYTRIQDKIVGGAKAKGGLAASLFARALASKLSALHESGTVTHGLWDAIVFSKVRKQLGLDRCSKMICGSAPIGASCKDLMRVVFGVQFIEGYGLTETAASGSVCHPEDVSNGHVGMVGTCAEVKLEDVTEMNYTSSSKGGSPPQGEICVRGPCVFKGYYKMADKTAEAIDDDGWFHTGDIGEWTPTGCLRIIDRKKNIFKLSQGEYVAAEKIETILARCQLIAQVFVYGDSMQAYLVGVVVPDAEEVPGWAKAQGLASTSVADIVGGADEPKLLKAIMEQMTAASKAAKLAGFEMVKKLHLDSEPWSVENGLLTPTFKLKRVDAKKKYKAVLDALYASEAAPTSKL